MLLERLSLVNGDADAVNNDADGPKVTVNGGDDSGKAARLPRWTRQEILVLIEGKRVAESRIRRGRAAGPALGSGPVESKWASVSSYCKGHGVNRRAIQCRKRWSNLAGDFKKIKEWESSAKEEEESFWSMRNDLKREKKLPGFFDREIYDILDGGMPAHGLVFGLAPAAEDVKEKPTPVIENGKNPASEDGLFSDEEVEKENEAPAIPCPTPISVKQYQPPPGGSSGQASAPEETSNEKQRSSSNREGESTSQERRPPKRKRFAEDVEDGGDPAAGLHEGLIQVLERNGRMLNAQLEAHNINFQTDMERRRSHEDDLLAVLNRLADAVGRIADKL